MNTKKVARLAAVLLTGRNPKGLAFNMNYYVAPKKELTKSEKEKITKMNCNTVACVAGMTLILDDNRMMGDLNTLYNYSEIARNSLELTDDQAQALFTPDPNEVDAIDGKYGWRYNVTEKQAGRVVANLLLTDEVDWSVRNKRIVVAGRRF